MTISEIIGLTISEIRYTYTFQNEYYMQEFHAFLKLSNGLIIEIPQFSDLELIENTERNKTFKKAIRPNKDCRKRIENQKIVDIHFCYYDNEHDMEAKAYIELENGTFFTEESYGPQGLTTVDLEMLTRSQFEERLAELDEDSEIRSFVNEI